MGHSDAESAQAAWYHRMAMFTQDIPFDDLLLAFAGEGGDVSEDATKINGLLSQVLLALPASAVLRSRADDSSCVCRWCCRAVDDVQR